MSSGMERWINRVALVTGASTGIGASICRELVRKGMVVVGCARNIENIEVISKEEEKLGSPGKLHAIRCDMSVESDIVAMHAEIATKYKRLDVCINNAICCINSSLVTGDSKDWRDMLEVNVMGLCINTREAIKLMTTSKEDEIEEAQIIHMGSIDGHRIPPLRKLKTDTSTPWFHVYFGTKFMTRALAEGLRQELKENTEISVNIRVSTISPGPVETDSYSRSTNPENAKNFFNEYKCLETQDVAGAVTYILSAPKHVNVNDVILAPVAYNM